MSAGLTILCIIGACVVAVPAIVVTAIVLLYAWIRFETWLEKEEGSRP